MVGFASSGLRKYDFSGIEIRKSNVQTMEIEVSIHERFSHPLAMSISEKA